MMKETWCPMKTRNKRRESDRYEKLLRNPSLCKFKREDPEVKKMKPQERLIQANLSSYERISMSTIKEALPGRLV